MNLLKRSLRIIQDLTQVFFIFTFLCVFMRLLSFERSSNIGGWIARVIGSRLPISTRAYRNLKLALPDLTERQHKYIVSGMWENLGRTFTEYVQLPSLDIYAKGSCVEVVGADIIDQLRDDGRPAILFLGHIANWEIGTFAATQRGLKIVQLYRRLNYPMTDALINWLHRKVAQEVITKGTDGARKMIEAVKQGKHVSMLSDQKLNEGELIPFFGHDARTAEGGARLALKFNCPFVPVRVERIHGTNFRVTYYPPIEVPQEGDTKEKVRKMLAEMNAHFESWIRERPEQWLWLHRRWPREADASK